MGRSELRGPSPRPSSWVISRPVQRVRPRVEVVGLPRRPSCLNEAGLRSCVVSVVACVWLVWTLCRAEIARDRRRVCYRQPTFQVSIAQSVVISRDLVLTVSCPKPAPKEVRLYFTLLDALVGHAPLQRPGMREGEQSSAADGRCLFAGLPQRYEGSR